MKTINQILNPNDTLLGHWSMWANKVVGDLNRLSIKRPTYINVEFTPVEYTTTDGHYWTCTHQSTHTDALEFNDVYKEAATGVPQPLLYQPVEVCDECNATYKVDEDVWYE